MSWRWAIKLLTQSECAQDLQNALLCVFANKQDMKGSMGAAEITEVRTIGSSHGLKCNARTLQALELHTIKSMDYHLVPCCALTGEGLKEGMDWIVNKLL